MNEDLNCTKLKISFFFPSYYFVADIDIKAFVKKPDTKVYDDDDDLDSVVTTAMVDITFETAASTIKCEKSPYLRSSLPTRDFLSSPTLKSRYFITSHTYSFPSYDILHCTYHLSDIK